MGYKVKGGKLQKQGFFSLPDGIADSGTVYHFTWTARLPWILESGELQPGRNQIGGFPVDFLWATTKLHGDHTASAMQGYSTGISALVKFKLHAEDFEFWPKIIERHPEWTSEHVYRLPVCLRPTP